MLMSLSQRYVFLSQRAASSNFEEAYGDSCEIACVSDVGLGRHPVTGGSGRHMGYRELLETFDDFFRRWLPVEKFFVFGTVREPLRRLRALYLGQLRSGRNNKGKYEPGQFARFVDDIIDAPPDSRGSVRSQYSFFMDADGDISLNYLIRMERLRGSLADMEELSGLAFPKALQQARAAAAARPAPPSITVDPGLQRVIEEHFGQDFELYEQKTDRLLREWDRSGKLNVEAALRSMMRGRNRYEIAGTLLHKAVMRLEKDEHFSLAELTDLIDARGLAQAA